MAERSQNSIRYSQNFLKDRRLLDRLLGASSIRTEELVIDIGAGRGLITQRLEALGAKVLAIERDSRLAAALRDRFARSASVTVCEADFLRIGLPMGPYKVFANIPFNLTAGIVAKLTTVANPPEDSYLAMQREAAERFTGDPTGTLQAMLL